MFVMKKASRKKSTAKKTPKSARQSKSPSASKSARQGTPAPASAAIGRSEKGKINKQPQVKQQAAVANAMFLYTDDAWSLRYFDPNDLHFKEREVFG
jgi:hypothetical protein